jgi:hypothetical protein
MTGLLFSIINITDDSIQVDNFKNGIGNSLSSKKYFIAENHISQPEPNGRLLDRPHIIRKRSTNQSFRSKRRRGKGRKRNKSKRYQDDTRRRKQTTYRTSRDDRPYSASSSNAPRDDRRYASYKKTDVPRDDIQYAESKPARVQSTRRTRDGILKATEVTANNINAISMTADYVVANTIFAQRIIGDVITVMPKRTRGPSMSEFIYNGKINNLNQRSSEGYDRSRYRSSKNTRSYNGKVQNGKLNMDNHKNYTDSSRSYKGKVQKKTYLANAYSNLRSMVTDNYGRSYRIHRQLSPPRHGLDETIIDTSNHPFISFQNGYVKRERIRKPNIGLKSRRTYKQVKRGRQRTHRRRTNHPSYWR